jgi:hypothetical protein
MSWIDNKYIFPRAAAANMQEIWPWPSPEESPPPPPPSINPLWRVKPQPAQSEGGDDFGATRNMPYNPEAILALDQNKWANLGLRALPFGGVMSALNSFQAQRERDDEMYNLLNDPSNRAESPVRVGPADYTQNISSARTTPVALNEGRPPGVMTPSGRATMHPTTPSVEDLQNIVNELQQEVEETRARDQHAAAWGMLPDWIKSQSPTSQRLRELAKAQAALAAARMAPTVTAPIGFHEGPSNTTDLGMDRSVAENLGAPYSTDQLAADLAALNNPDAPFSVAALDPSSFAPPGYDFEDPYGGLLGFGDLSGVLGDMYRGAERGVASWKDSMLGLLADADAPKSPNPLLMTDEAYAAAYSRANPRAGFSPATLAALAQQDAWAGGIAHGFGVGGPGDTSGMGVYGVDPTQPGGWGYLGTELEVQQNPDITQGPYGWGNYSGSSTGADYIGTPTGAQPAGPSNIYGGVNAGWEDDGGYSDPGGGVSSGAAAETLGDEGGWGPSF